MAALYLHNAIHSPDHNTNTHSSPHRRNTSSYSNATLQSTSEISHPTEPLLQSSTFESVAYLDLLSRQPSYPSTTRPTWTTGLSLEGDPVSPTERKWSRERLTQGRIRRLKYAKGSLEIIMAIWAIYNTVRYFMAYATYESKDGQAASLALGITTGVSFTLLVCAFILAIFQPYLVFHDVALSPILHARSILHALASFTLFGPAVVSLVLLFIWGNSSVKEINIKHRCHVDLDVIWSVSNKECKPPAWGVWIALSILRIVVTLLVIISYHWIAIISHRLRRLSFSRSWRHSHSAGIPSESYHTPLTPSMAAISGSSLMIPQRSTLHSQHQSSESTLRSNPHSKHSSGHLPSYNASYNAFPSTCSDEDSDGLHSPDSRSQPGNQFNINNTGNDVELDHFRDRFQSLVHQITQEVEEGLELVRSDTQPLQQQDSEPHSGPSSLSTMVPSVDEFGIPYPPDERVSFLNGYVRRMPTIESMGSREAGTGTVSSVHTTDRDTMISSIKSISSSGPPTRTNTLASRRSAGSRPPSRMSIAAADTTSTSRANEVGELVVAAASAERANSQGSTSSSHPSTTTYHSAKSYASVAMSESIGELELATLPKPNETIHTANQGTFIGP